MDALPSGDDAVSKPARDTLNLLLKELPSSSSFSFLDIGCGDGRDISFFSSQLNNLKFRGIDISKEAIQKAVARNSNDKKITFECMDWKELDNTQYDIIYTSGVYHFFPLADRITFLQKITNILKPQGFFILTTLSANDTQYFGQGDPVENDPNSFQSDYFIHFSSEEELRQDFSFLKLTHLYEYFHKNYAQDTEYHTMWLVLGRKKF